MVRDGPHALIRTAPMLSGLRVPEDQESEAHFVAALLHSGFHVVAAFLGVQRSAPSTLPWTRRGSFSNLASIQKPANLIFLTESPNNYAEAYFHSYQWDPPTNTSHWPTGAQYPNDMAVNQHRGGFNCAYLQPLLSHH